MTCTRSFTAIAAFVAATLAATTFIPTDAEAKRGGSRYQQWEFDTDRPVRGYEGFGGDGRYCSYRREPQHKCVYGHGGESCQIVSWRLIQKCY